MTTDNIVGLVITGIIGIIIIIMAILMLLGKGSFLIAGYNTMSKYEKSKYDEKALCKFMGKLLLPIGLFMPTISIGAIYSIDWLGIVYGVMVFVEIVFAAVYCNTGNHFKK